jgi:hypothetical protein
MPDTNDDDDDAPRKKNSNKAPGRPRKDPTTVPGPPPVPFMPFASILKDLEEGNFNICADKDGQRMIAVCPGMGMFCIFCQKVFKGLASLEKHFTQNNCPLYRQFQGAQKEAEELKKLAHGSNTFVLVTNDPVSFALAPFVFLTKMFISDANLNFLISLFSISDKNDYHLMETLFSDKNLCNPTRYFFLIPLLYI